MPYSPGGTKPGKKPSRRTCKTRPDRLKFLPKIDLRRPRGYLDRQRTPPALNYLLGVATKFGKSLLRDIEPRLLRSARTRPVVVLTGELRWAVAFVN